MNIPFTKYEIEILENYTGDHDGALPRELASKDLALEQAEALDAWLTSLQTSSQDEDDMIDQVGERLEKAIRKEKKARKALPK
jgi:hypothetical protein